MAKKVEKSKTPSKMMVCTSCGWKWKVSDGSMCHKCGGKAKIK